VQLTKTYATVIPKHIQARYEFREVRNAAAVLAAVAPIEFADILQVLEAFTFSKSDITTPGGNKTKIALKLDTDFRELKWREGKYDLEITSTLTKKPYQPAGENQKTQIVATENSSGYLVDNLKGRVALDVEWNAKDGNLHRDLTAYRVFYEQALVDAAVLVTRTVDDLHALALQLGRDSLGGTTTTNLPKLEPLLARGSAGGCPVLAVAITARCYKP
jgi:hypothetical protein